VELKVMKEWTRRQSSQSEKVKIFRCYYQWQILKPSEKRKAKRGFTVSVKTPKGTEKKANLKGTTEIARSRGSAR
jgi:hypothetical protein